MRKSKKVLTLVLVCAMLFGTATARADSQSGNMPPSGPHNLEYVGTANCYSCKYTNAYLYKCMLCAKINPEGHYKIVCPKCGYQYDNSI